jgi:hypothetical protein
MIDPVAALLDRVAGEYDAVVPSVAAFGTRA